METKFDVTIGADVNVVIDANMDTIMSTNAYQCLIRILLYYENTP